MACEKFAGREYFRLSAFQEREKSKQLLFLDCLLNHLFTFFLLPNFIRGRKVLTQLEAFNLVK